MVFGEQLSFYACAQDANYAAEHFGVAISTTSGTDPDAFTMLQEWTMTAKDSGAPTEFTRSGNRTQGNWYLFTIDLSQYAGQTGYVAIRHFDCHDMFWLDVDDITLLIPGEGPMEYDYGSACTLTAMANEGYVFSNWTENGTVVSSDVSYSFMVTESRTLTANFIQVCAVDPENVQAQVDRTAFTEATVSWESDNDLFDMRYRKVQAEGFEGGIPEGWATIDADGDGYNWGSIRSMYSYVSGHNSEDGVASQSYIGRVLYPDNYLVSPQCELGGVLTFWACAYASNYAADHFGVAVSTGSQTDPADFTTLQEWTMTAKGVGQGGDRMKEGNRAQGTWYQYTVDLSDYEGQTGYIAIRHFDCYDQWAIFVDDFVYGFPDGWTLVEGITDHAYLMTNLDDMSDYVVQVRSSCGDGESYSNWVETWFTNKHYTINVTVDPEEGGSVDGAGAYFINEDCILVAVPEEGYSFINWTENGEVISTGTSYTIRVTGNHNLVAHFEKTCTIDPENVQAQVDRTAFTEATVSWESDNDLFDLRYRSLFVDDFENGLSSEWTIIDHDGDNYTWYHASGDAIVAHSGTGVATSDSYINYVGAMNPDNWLVSPRVELGGTMTFWACGQDPSYVSEHFGVFVSTAGTEVSDFVQVMAETIVTSAMTQYTVDLSAYSGNGYFAIRHYNCTDMFRLNVDDVSYSSELTTISGITSTDYTLTGLDDMSDYIVEVRSSCGDGENYSNWVGTSITTKHFTISAVADPVEGGSVNGSGVYLKGDNCVLMAEPAEGYAFMYWTENGQQVSTQASYSIDVWDDRTLVAHFSLPLTITASADPEEGGAVEGAGVYDYGTVCTLTATPSDGYVFVNWTENGQQVSSDANYSFDVTNDRELVAHFAIPLVITASADPVEGGMVSGVGEYVPGATCTLHASPAQGYLLSYWTYNDEVVSELVDYSFVVSESGHYVAHFEPFQGVFVGDDNSTSETCYLPSYNYYKYSLTQQIYTAEEIGRGGAITAVSFFCARQPNNAARVLEIYLVHTDKTVYENNTDWIPVTAADRVFSAEVTFTAGTWNTFTLTQPFVYNGTDNLALIVDDNSGHWESTRYFRTYGAEGNQSIRIYSDNTDYDPFNPQQYSGTLMNVKNNILFWMLESGEAEQALNLAAGWNWWSSSLEMNATVEAALKEAISAENTSATIKNSVFNTMLENGSWSSHPALTNESMYMILVDNAVTTTLTAAPADPTAHPITLYSGWNWIGFPSVNTIALTEALAGLNPTEGDVIKGNAGNATYSDAYGWNGSLNNLVPGEGYMFLNNADEAMTLTFPATAKAYVRSLPVETYWTTDVHRHATNLVMLATLDAERFAMGEGNYEIGAFVGDECRGSARLQRVGSQYIAYLTINGENGEAIRFRLYDVVNNMEHGLAEEQLSYVANAVTGTVHEPVVLHFRATDVNESEYSVSVYPNPTNGQVKIEGREIESVKVYNALGQLVYMEESGNADNVELHLEGLSAGVYTVAIRTSGTMVTKRVVKE